MKIKLTIAALLILALYACTTNITAAQSPEPLNWQYAAVKCTSLPLATIQSEYQKYSSQYGYDHNLPDGKLPGGLDVWKAAYPNMVNEFLRQFGCPDGLNLEGTSLTVWQLHYHDIYQHALGTGEQP